MLSPEVEQVVEQAFKEAKNRRQEFATVEHLCLVLFDAPRIKSLLSQIGVSKSDLKQRFIDFIDNKIERLPLGIDIEVLPSLGFQRVLQRAAVHIVGAGREEVLLEHVLVATFDEDESNAVYMMLESGITRLDLVSVISHGVVPGEDYSLDANDEASKENADQRSTKESPLAKFTTCLTDEARAGRLDQMIGRDPEILRTLQVLSRRRKNNPLFVGDPGVGKTALAEGLAIRVVEKKVPKHLEDSEIYLLDMGAMLAGTRYRGDFESRMKSVLKEIEKKGSAIIVIDEIHTVIGAGATTGSSMDASNLLKPILSKGVVRCIGSTTHREYRAHFERDRALARRFQKIDIDEPSFDDCVAILSGLKKRYEDFHGVTIDDEAIKSAVGLSIRFLHERKLPDKALDLIDEACARARLADRSHISQESVQETVAAIAQIPSQQISNDDKEVLKKLETTLKNSIFGQDPAIAQVANAILLSRAGLREKEKPIGSFLFSGPSGVGKTEVAKMLAEALGVNLLRFDMSEYMERHTASRLVGAPPGYVGFDQGGLLTEAINKTPYAVLLLDEIEKAHPDVFNMLLQVMDYGKLTDSNGRAADFRHVILIMTSNVGARELEQRAIGFSRDPKSGKDDKALKRLFSVEFRNRLDAQISFNPLSKDIMVQVVDKLVRELANQLADKKVSVSLTNEAKDHLAQIGHSPTMGARPLARIIEEQIKKPIAKELVFGSLVNGGNVLVTISDGNLSLAFETI